MAAFPQLKGKHKSYGSKNWDFYRHEIECGVGLSNYIGDVGGAASSDSPFSPKVVAWNQFKWSTALAYRYNLGRWFAVKPMFFAGRIASSDESAQNEGKIYRNLKFESNIYEFSCLAELHLIRAELGHSNYHPGVIGSAPSRIGVSAHVGVGVFFYDPRLGRRPLRDLSTEGQGLPGGPEEYGKTAIAVPLGFIVGYQLTTKLRIGIDFTTRLTNTDYLDDVSGVYFDKEIIRNHKGDFAAEMSDRSTGAMNWTSPGSPRGNPNNDDFYFAGLITVTYTPLIRSYGNSKRRPKAKF